MINKFLLPSQTDQLYNILLKEYDINPREFDVKHSEVEFKLSHIRTGFYFLATCSTDKDLSVSKFFTEFLPTNTNTIRPGHVNSFSEILGQYKIWVKHLARELKQADYWSILLEGTDSYILSSKVSASNSLFSLSEQNSLEKKLIEIENFIFSNFELERNHNQFVKSQLQYLKDAVKRSELSRIDWLNLSIGVFMSIILAISLEPEKAKTLINFVCKILSPIFGGSIPLLP